jgi:hemolysin activation/secretion protein
VPNFNQVEREIVALNQWLDRRVTPTLRGGVEPGTVDVDLKVKDILPLHGSVELNNRYSQVNNFPFNPMVTDCYRCWLAQWC